MQNYPNPFNPQTTHFKIFGVDLFDSTSKNDFLRIG